MATATTLQQQRAPIPRNYFCKSCGLGGHHWIMDCSLLTFYHAARNVLKQANEINTISSVLYIHHRLCTLDISMIITCILYISSIHIIS